MCGNLMAKRKKMWWEKLMRESRVKLQLSECHIPEERCAVLILA